VTAAAARPAPKVLKGIFAPSGLVLPLPEVIEALGGELGVAGGVLDVAVPEPPLDGAGVVAGVGEGEAAGVPQHVRVDREGELGRYSDHRELLPEPGSAHRRASLGREQVGRGRGLLALQPARVLIGAVNLLVEISEHQGGEATRHMRPHARLSRKKAERRAGNLLMATLPIAGMMWEDKAVPRRRPKGRARALALRLMDESGLGDGPSCSRQSARDVAPAASPADCWPPDA
jgi:hypothetical protein